MWIGHDQSKTYARLVVGVDETGVRRERETEVMVADALGGVLCGLHLQRERTGREGNSRESGLR